MASNRKRHLLMYVKVLVRGHVGVWVQWSHHLWQLNPLAQLSTQEHPSQWNGQGLLGFIQTTALPMTDHTEEMGATWCKPLWQKLLPSDKAHVPAPRAQQSSQGIDCWAGALSSNCAGGGSQVCSTNEHSCSHYNDGLLKALLLLCVLLGHLCLL